MFAIATTHVVCQAHGRGLAARRSTVAPASRSVSCRAVPEFEQKHRQLWSDARERAGALVKVVDEYRTGDEVVAKQWAEGFLKRAFPFLHRQEEPSHGVAVPIRRADWRVADGEARPE